MTPHMQRALLVLDTPAGGCVATLTAPSQAGDCSNVGVLVVPPFGIEHCGFDRTSRQLAERLTSDGHTVLTIDPVGMGDSADLPDDVNLVASYEQATLAALSYLRTQVSRVVGIGIRFGALALAHSLADDPLLGRRLEGALLWAPIERGRNYRRELMLLGASTSAGLDEGWAAPAGHVLRPNDLAAIGTLDLRNTPAPSRRIMVLQPTEAPFSTEVAEAWRGVASVDTVVDDGLAEAVLEDPEKGTVPTSTVERIAGWVQTLREPADRPSTFDAPPAPERDGVRHEGVVHGPGWSEDAVTVTLRDGYVLQGIRTLPVHEPRAGLLMLATGTNPRFGPARLHTLIARTLAERGFAVVRLDRRGAGIAAGSIDAYDPVHVDDVHDIDAAAAALLGTSKVLLSGLCSGAWAAWHATLSGVTATEVMLVNQIIFGEDSWDLTEDSPAIAVKTRQSLTDAQRWKALLKGEINVQRSARRLVRYVALQAKNRFGEGFDGLSADLAKLREQGTPVRFIFDADETGLVYLRMHGSDALPGLEVRGKVRVQTIAGAGHVFAPPATAQWLADAMINAMEGVERSTDRPA